MKIRAPAKRQGSRFRDIENVIAALDPHLIKQRPRLSFFPKFANMLGGTMINVTGPCFPENAKIECQFQDMSGGRFPAIYRDRNHASCYMPPVFFHGYVDLTVTINNGDALFYGRFYIRELREEPKTKTSLREGLNGIPISMQFPPI